jgi:hypothetical protein
VIIEALVQASLSQRHRSEHRVFYHALAAALRSAAPSGGYRSDLLSDVEE